MVEKVAIIGAGLMGRWHSHFAKSCGAEIEAVVDADESRARALADKIGSKNVFRHIDQLFARTEASVVHICTPTQTHSDLVQQCIQAQRHVLVEKPFAENLDLTRKLLNSAHDAGVLINPVHQFPFQRGYLELLERKSSLGDPVRVDFITCSAGGDGKSLQERKEIMLEILPHPVSLLCRLFGDAGRFSSFQIVRFTDSDLELVASTGNTAISVIISLRGRPTRNELTFVGEAGSAFIDLFHGYSVFEAGEVSRSAKILKPLKFSAGMFLKAGSNLAMRAAASEPAYPGLRELISRFYDAVDNKLAAPISDDEIVFAAETIENMRNAQTAKLSP